jgi:hypothetical protein
MARKNRVSAVQRGKMGPNPNTTRPQSIHSRYSPYNDCSSVFSRMTTSELDAHSHAIRTEARARKEARQASEAARWAKSLEARNTPLPPIPTAPRPDHFRALMNITVPTEANPNGVWGERWNDQAPASIPGSPTPTNNTAAQAHNPLAPAALQNSPALIQSPPVEVQSPTIASQSSPTLTDGQSTATQSPPTLTEVSPTSTQSPPTVMGALSPSTQGAVVSTQSQATQTMGPLAVEPMQGIIMTQSSSSDEQVVMATEQKCLVSTLSTSQASTTMDVEVSHSSLQIHSPLCKK